MGEGRRIGRDSDARGAAVRSAAADASTRPAKQTPARPAAQPAAGGPAANQGKDDGAARFEDQVALVMGVSLTDAASRMRARQTVEELGARNASAAKSRLLEMRVHALALADSDSDRVAADLQKLATKVSKLDPTRGGSRRPSLIERYFDSPEKQVERVLAARNDIESIISSLSESARAIRQNNVALDAFEADIQAESELLEHDLARADAYEAALTAAIERERQANGASKRLSFVETDVLYPLEELRQHLGSLRAVNQQAALSLVVLRDTNALLVQSIQQVIHAARYALKVASMLRTPQAAPAATVAVAPQGSAPDDRSFDAELGLTELRSSLDELFRALEESDTWRKKASALTREAMGEIEDMTAELSAALEHRQRG